MATKVQQLQRYEGSRYRERRAPTVDPVRAPHSGSLPAVPVNWFPQQARALEFSQKLLGAAPVVESLMKTEAGEQYKEARARAMRGEFTIDGSGIFTFTKEQQRALSEVEGTLDADRASAELAVNAETWKQELASDETVTPAQRVALFSERVRQAAYGDLSNTKDSDYLIAKGGRLHDAATRLIQGYTRETIGKELAKEREMTGQVLNNTLSRMPTNLTVQQETAYRIDALAEFHRNWTRVTGLPFSAAGEQLSPMLTDLVISGNDEALERLKDAPLPDGSTLGGLGLISKSMLDKAAENADKIEEREFQRRQRVWRDNQQLYGSQSIEFRNRIQLLPTLSGEEKEREIEAITSGIMELTAELQALDDDAFDYNGKAGLLKQLADNALLAAQGGPKEMLPDSAANLLRTALSNDYASAMPLFREYGAYIMPNDLVKPMEAALSWKDDAARQEQEKMLWMFDALGQVKPPIVEEELDRYGLPTGRVTDWRNTPDGRSALSLLASAFDAAGREHPEWSVEQRRAEAEKQLYARYPKATAEEQIERRSAKELIDQARTLDPNGNPETAFRLATGFRSMSEPNKRALLAELARNDSLDAEQRATLQGLADAPDQKLAQTQIVTTREALYAAQNADPNNPVSFFGKHGNDLFKPLTTLDSHRILVTEKTETGQLRVVEKMPLALSSADEPLTGLYPKGARIIKGTKIVPISSLSSESDLALLDRKAPPVSSDPKVPRYNPQAYPDDEIPRPNGPALFSFNWTNRSKPIEDHSVIVKEFPKRNELSLSPWVHGLGQVFVKRYGDCTELEKSRIVSPPFDPDYRIMLDGRRTIIRLRDWPSYVGKGIYTTTPVDFMSAREQIKLLME